MPDRAATEPGVARPPRARADALLWAVAAMIFTNVWRVQDLFPVLSRLKLAMLSTAVMLGLFIIDRGRWRRVKWLRSPLFTIWLVLLGLVTLSGPFGLFPGQSFWFVVQTLIPLALLALIIAAGVRSTADVDWVVRVNVVGAVLYALYVLKNFHEGGELQRLNKLVYYDANDFALLMVCSIPMAVYMLRAKAPRLDRLLGLVSLFLSAIALLKSGSRGGFLGFVAVMLYILFRFRAIPVKARIGSVIAGALVLILGASPTYWANISSILEPSKDYNYVGNSETGRMEIWKRGLGYMWQRPVLGVGVHNFPVAEGTLSEAGQRMQASGHGFKWSVAHNSYVEIGAEVGVGGLLLFLALLTASALTLRRVIRYCLPEAAGGGREVELAQALMGAFLGFAICGFFISAEYFALLFVLIGLTMGIYKAARIARIPATAPAPATGDLHMMNVPVREAGRRMAR